MSIIHQPTFQLTMLRSLHRSMRQNRVERAAFSYNNNRGQIHAVFITDEQPYVLFIAVRGSQPHPYTFECLVHPGYRVVSYLGEHYKPLLNALGVESNPDNPFSTKKFLAHLNDQIPSDWKPREIPTELLALRSSSKNIEELHKRYFVGWRLHNEKRVTLENLDKTRKWIGQAAYQRCRMSNISSCWSENEHDRRSITPPPTR